jgi:hypothetical protein
MVDDSSLATFAAIASGTPPGLLKKSDEGY